MTSKAVTHEGLVSLWLDIEDKSDRKWVDILAELNETCGTRYRHNWLSQLRTRPSQNLPIAVRQYLMRRVLPVLFTEAGLTLPHKKIAALVVNLT